ncbi:MAG: hypothetical protein K2X86_04645 [Cytophagaceae bacterium]|nr:hypothetical protein [Cytophagaceae bacterium]
MDKHLLAENPMRASEGGLAIIRTSQPVAIFEVIDMEEAGGSISVEGKIIKSYYYQNEHWVLKTHYYFTHDIDTTDESEVYKFMDDAWFWFMAYLKWEDKNIDNDIH